MPGQDGQQDGPVTVTRNHADLELIGQKLDGLIAEVHENTVMRREDFGKLEQRVRELEQNNARMKIIEDDVRTLKTQSTIWNSVNSIAVIVAGILGLNKP